MRLRPLDAGKAVDLAAAAIFAGAAGFAASALLGGWAILFASSAAFVLAFVGLRRVDADCAPGLPHFALSPVDAVDDQADEPGDDRVVCLFGPRRHVIAGSFAESEGTTSPDAGAALSDALAELKRSLR